MSGRYTRIEPGLSQANQQYIKYDKNKTHQIKIQVERIVKKIIQAMKRESRAFARLSPKMFGGGSSYEGLKVGADGDFDIDVLLTIPKVARAVLREDVIPGFVQLQLQNFQALEVEEPELYREMEAFVDNRNFLLTSPLKSFTQSVFDRALNNSFPNNVIPLGSRRYEILRIQNAGPAFTLTIEGLNLDFFVKIDLVPCILLTGDHWPKGGFRENPYSEPSKFFIVPKKPKRYHRHLDRYFRLSFQKQERDIIFDRKWVKPTIRVVKCMKYHFGQEVSSYAIKTLFMWELLTSNPALDDDTPVLWNGPFSDCVVHMLRRYVHCLTEHTIRYFWNSRLNLLDNLSYEQIENYKRKVEAVLRDIMENPVPETVLRYLTL